MGIARRSEEASEGSLIHVCKRYGGRPVLSARLQAEQQVALSPSSCLYLQNFCDDDVSTLLSPVHSDELSRRS